MRKSAEKTDAVLAEERRLYLKKMRIKSELQRKRKEEAGLVQKNLWIPAEYADFLTRIAETIRQHPGERFAFCLEDPATKKFSVTVQSDKLGRSRSPS